MHSKLTLEFVFMFSLEKRSISDRSRTSFVPPKNSKAKKPAHSESEDRDSQANAETQA
jgi:hypothetical protein